MTGLGKLRTAGRVAARQFMEPEKVGGGIGLKHSRLRRLTNVGSAEVRPGMLVRLARSTGKGAALGGVLGPVAAKLMGGGFGSMAVGAKIGAAGGAAAGLTGRIAAEGVRGVKDYRRMIERNERLIAEARAARAKLSKSFTKSDQTRALGFLQRTEAKYERLLADANRRGDRGAAREYSRMLQRTQRSAGKLARLDPTRQSGPVIDPKVSANVPGNPLARGATRLNNAVAVAERIRDLTP